MIINNYIYIYINHIYISHGKEYNVVYEKGQLKSLFFLT